MPDHSFPLPSVTTGPLPASRKVHVAGRHHPGLRVPMREIALHPTSGEPAVGVYDSSGPYTDPAVTIDIAAGLHPVRASWVAARGDTDPVTGRVVLPQDNGFVAAAQAHRTSPGCGSRAGRAGMRR